MNVLNAIPEELKPWLKNNSTNFFEGYDDDDTEEESLHVEVSSHEPFKVGDFQAKLEEHYGGEDQGSTYYSIYSFTKGDEVVYVKFDGWYQSYNGSEFEEYFVVIPEQKMTTEYKRLK